MTRPPEAQSFVCVYRPKARTVLICPANGSVIEIPEAEASALYAALGKVLVTVPRVGNLLRATVENFE